MRTLFCNQRCQFATIVQLKARKIIGSPPEAINCQGETVGFESRPFVRKLVAGTSGFSVKVLHTKTSIFRTTSTLKSAQNVSN